LGDSREWHGIASLAQIQEGVEEKEEVAVDLPEEEEAAQ